MKCFNHAQNEAVGVCSFCHKGLCPDCVSDWGGRLSCRSVCEEEVKKYFKTMARARQASRQQAAMMAAIGLLFFCNGAALSLIRGLPSPLVSFIDLLGFFLILTGVLRFFEWMK